MDKTKEVTDALEALPDDPDKIAILFRTIGIKGVMCKPGGCPIAKYIKGIVPGFLSVGPGDASFYPDGGNGLNYAGERALLHVTTPESIREFIANFDQEKYPDLLEETV